MEASEKLNSESTAISAVHKRRWFYLRARRKLMFRVRLLGLPDSSYHNDPGPEKNAKTLWNVKNTSRNRNSLPYADRQSWLNSQRLQDLARLQTRSRSLLTILT